MNKVFSNKKLAYALIGILLALQLTQSIANWVGGGFNGGSLILCILMLGLLSLVAVGIAKKNKLLSIIGGIAILTVTIYILVSEYSGLVIEGIERDLHITFWINVSFPIAATLLLIGCLILIIIRACNVTKNVKTVNAVFSIIAAIFILITVVITLVFGLKDTEHTVTYNIYSIARDFFVLFISLLIPCIWHQIEDKE